MGRFLFYAVGFVVVLYAFIDVVLSRGDDVRSLPKALWAVVVVIVPVLGAAAWFIWGRPRAQGAGSSSPGRGRGPVAPDDDPAFLRQIDEVTWSEKMRRRREKRDGGNAPGNGATPAS